MTKVREAYSDKLGDLINLDFSPKGAVKLARAGAAAACRQASAAALAAALPPRRRRCEGQRCRPREGCSCQAEVAPAARKP